MLNKIKATLTGLGIIFLMSACSGTSLENHKRNQVEMVRLPYMLTFSDGSNSLDDGQIQKLDHFLIRLDVSYGDELSLDFSFEENGDISPLNQTRMAYMSDLLKRRGLHLSPLLTPFGAEPAENKARLLISRYVVTPPQCGDWSQPITNYSNTPLKDFGCTTQAQLGLMIANPRDLIIGQSHDSPNTQRAIKPVNAYQSGN